MAYRQKRLTVSIPGVEGVRIVFENSSDSEIDVAVMHNGRTLGYIYLWPSTCKEAIAALGFPTEEEPVEVTEVEGKVEE